MDSIEAAREVVYNKYRRIQSAEMADWYPGFDMQGVSVSEADQQAGSPRLGDKIARNPANHDDRWLVAAAYFEANFEPHGEDSGLRAAAQRVLYHLHMDGNAPQAGHIEALLRAALAGTPPEPTAADVERVQAAIGRARHGDSWEVYGVPEAEARAALRAARGLT